MRQIIDNASGQRYVAIRGICWLYPRVTRCGPLAVLPAVAIDWETPPAHILDDH